MLDGEKLMTLAAAAEWLHETRGVRRTKDALYRWQLVGVRGVRLEVMDVGGRLHTSAEAMERFFAAATLARGEPIRLGRG